MQVSDNPFGDSNLDEIATPPHRTLIWGTVREALDMAVPADVAPVGCTMEDPSVGTPIFPMRYGADIDMAIFKGIVAGALASVSAQKVAYISSEDMGSNLLNSDWEPKSASGAEMSKNLDDYDSLPDAIAACYYGHIEATNGGSIDLSTEPGDDFPFIYSYIVQVRIYKWPSADMSYMITVHLEGEGGPPTDFYFVRN